MIRCLFFTKHLQIIACCIHQFNLLEADGVDLKLLASCLSSIISLDLVHGHLTFSDSYCLSFNRKNINLANQYSIKRRSDQAVFLPTYKYNIYVVQNCSKSTISCTDSLNEQGRNVVDWSQLDPELLAPLLPDEIDALKDQWKNLTKMPKSITIYRKQ
ncbi:hypothetical protein BC833DRAFT_647377 [Globomyces pollinis-pini]|nr:hypothetical protein BC833DRAFT_647377 [Globomyces pollinis-pini]